jgi:NADH-quinone oxidoreductase subunit L
MTVPLMVLAFFAVTYGWVGIPEHFPGLGGILPNWFHGFVGSTLAEEPEALAFSWIPLLTSLGVALGGLFFGWLYYRNVNSAKEDFFQIPVLKNKWYFDEAYSATFIRFFNWVSEVAVPWIDKTVIDGILHFVGTATNWLGDKIRTYIDLKFINEFVGDGSGNVVKWTGRNLRPIQTGRVQQYMLAALLTIIIVGVILTYFLSAA